MTPFEDHLHSPRNAGALENPDVMVAVENPVCGDILRLFLRLSPTRTVREARFQVLGCPSAIAAGSVLTTLLDGRAPGEVASIDDALIDRTLGGLNGERLHAAHLAADAAREAAGAMRAWSGANS